MIFQEIDHKSGIYSGHSFQLAEGDKLSYLLKVENSSGDSLYYYQEAKSALDGEEYILAKQMIDQAIALDPTHAEYYCCRAEILIASYSGKLPLFMQKLGEILSDLDQSLDINPSYAEGLYLRGMMLFYFLDKEREGIKQIRAAAELGHPYAQVIYKEMRSCPKT